MLLLQHAGCGMELGFPNDIGGLGILESVPSVGFMHSCHL
jgi:hypothetical protein